MSFLNILGDIGKIAAPVVGGIAGGPFGAALGAGIGKAIGGLQEDSEANALSAQNPRPVDAPENELLQNEAEANQRAEQGMGAQQYSNSENDIQRNQNFALRAGTQRNGGLATINGIAATSNDATNRLNQQDEADRMKNQDMAYQIRSALARRRQQAFDWNDKQKFLENASAIRALKAASAQNMFGAATTIAGAGIQQPTPNGMGGFNYGGNNSGATSGWSGLAGGFSKLFGGGGSGGADEISADTFDTPDGI